MYSGQDIFCLKNFDTFTRTSVGVLKMNAVAHAQLTFHRFTFPSKIFIQSSAVITGSNIVRYHMNNYRNRISIRWWIHKRHPIPRPNGRAMGCLLWIFVKKIDRVITASYSIWCMITWTLLSAIQERPLKRNHSLTHLVLYDIWLICTHNLVLFNQ